MIDRECLHGTPAPAPDHRVDWASEQACPLNDRDDHFNYDFSAVSGVLLTVIFNLTTTTNLILSNTWFDPVVLIVFACQSKNQSYYLSIASTVIVSQLDPTHDVNDVLSTTSGILKSCL